MEECGVFHLKKVHKETIYEWVEEWFAYKRVLKKKDQVKLHQLILISFMLYMHCMLQLVHQYSLFPFQMLFLCGSGLYCKYILGVIYLAFIYLFILTIHVFLTNCLIGWRHSCARRVANEAE